MKRQVLPPHRFLPTLYHDADQFLIPQSHVLIATGGAPRIKSQWIQCPDSISACELSQCKMSSCTADHVKFAMDVPHAIPCKLVPSDVLRNFLEADEHRLRGRVDGEVCWCCE